MRFKFIISVLVLLAVPLAASAFQLVPCGTSAPGDHPCTFIDLVTLLIRMINYLISVAAIVAMYQVLTAGFGLVSALGDPEKIQGAKTAISNTVVGLLMVVMS